MLEKSEIIMGHELTLGDLERDGNLYRIQQLRTEGFYNPSGVFHRIRIENRIGKASDFVFEFGKFRRQPDQVGTKKDGSRGVIQFSSGLTWFEITHELVRVDEWISFSLMTGIRYGFWMTWPQFKSEVRAKEFMGIHCGTVPTTEPTMGNPSPPYPTHD